MTTLTTIEVDRDAFVDRLFGATVASLELFGVYLGVRLGFYQALADGGEMTANALASETAVHPRYAREWLEQQTVAEILTVVASGDDEGARRFSLPAAHREVLADPANVAYVAPFALMLAGIGRVLPDLVEAYRSSGGGVPWNAYGQDMRDGQAAINRPAFVHHLASWIEAMPDVHERLRAAPPAQVADIGCGVGWSSIELARAYPDIHVEGFDLDPASVAEARRNGDTAGLGERVFFTVRDATDSSLAGRFDLACIFEALHDMARPVEALSAIREMLAPGGSVLVMDERVADQFTSPAGDVERMMYGWSIVCCLPTAMAEPGAVGTGTVLRRPILHRYATDAGYTSVDELPIDDDFFRFYRLRP